jgi:lipoprotein-releasing system ATP-binding protein
MKGIVKKYKNEKYNVLDNITIDIKKGDFAALIGQSGSGKSTILNIISGFEKPNEGSVFFDNKEINKYTEKQMNLFRSKKIGVIYQYHNLLLDFTVIENVILPALLNMSKKEAKIKAIKILKELGLEDKINKYPDKLSGGEKQRVSIARAIINEPELIIADEPTGSLDSKTASVVFDLLKRLNKEKGITFLLVTHDITLAKRSDYALEIKSGKITKCL